MSSDETAPSWSGAQDSPRAQVQPCILVCMRLFAAGALTWPCVVGLKLSMRGSRRRPDQSSETMVALQTGPNNTSDAFAQVRFGLDV